MRPKRETTRQADQTYFVTSQTAERLPLFRHSRWAELFADVLRHYAATEYALHAFVVMHDHFHLLLSPSGSIERTMQCIKGGFSYRAKGELGWNGPIWQTGFTDHRIRDEDDYRQHVRYLEQNPVRAGLVAAAILYPFSSANGLFRVEGMPQRLKPHERDGLRTG